MKHDQLPGEFIWGAATSSYQIEGAWNADGKGESIWDRFTHEQGHILDGSTGDVATDHYHRYPEDVALMADLGFGAYRFSLSWSRILPKGRGEINHGGLDFYSRLLDELFEHGITPYITLYHWDLPQALEDAGGWPVRATAEAFAEYADVVTRAYGDRVKNWTTFNEPWVSAYQGYYEGDHAPGRKNMQDMVAASHHLLLAHGLAMPVIRGNVPNANAGIVLNLSVHHAASPSAADRAAAYRDDGVLNRWYLDPLSGRGYPADIARLYGADLSCVQAGDLEAISTPIDYLGLNYYYRGLSRDEQAENNLPVTVSPNEEHTAMGWEVHPEGLYETLARVHYDYYFPAYFITENGAAYPDEVVNGQVDDPKRVSYLKAHLRSCAHSIQAGIPLKGYFVWSFLDNFEWAWGYKRRFGIVHVDYETLKRTPKASAYYLRDVIAANAVIE